MNLRLYSRPFYLVLAPELIQQALVTHASKTRKDDLFDHIRRALGNGLATSEQPLWHRQRKFMAPAFTPRAVAAHADTIVDSTLCSLDQWSDGQLLELHEAATRITLEVVSRSFFGESVQGEVDGVFEALRAIGDYYVTALASPVFLPSWSPLPSNIRFVRAVRRIDSIVEKLIEQRRRTGPTDDLLSDLLFGRVGHPREMSDRQIRDECMTLFIAGHETSGLALLYTLYLLLSRPDVEANLRREVETVLQGRRATDLDVEKLPRIEQVVRESMRLHPPAWITARRVLETFELGGYVVPAGAALMFSPWVTHRDPSHFASPQEFRPERWSSDFVKSLPRCAYFPFGAGPRACLGNHFAMTELILTVATLLQRADLTLQPHQSIEHSLSVTLRPKDRIHARFRRVPAWRGHANRSVRASVRGTQESTNRNSRRCPSVPPMRQRRSLRVAKETSAVPTVSTPQTEPPAARRGENATDE